jgi:CheY-like chemotaxis protein
LKRILLVEDCPLDAEMTLKALASQNLADEVVHLRDGVEALDFLYGRGQFPDRSQGKPTVVLLDLKMPKVNGLEVLRQIKSDPQLKTIPVVVMTSSRESRDLQAAYQLGVNAYVVKPLKFPQFVQAIEQVGAFWAVLNEPPPRAVSKPEQTR